MNDQCMNMYLYIILNWLLILFSTYRLLTIQFQFFILLNWHLESRFIFFFGWNNALLRCNLIVQTNSKNTHYWTIETAAWCNIQSIGVGCPSILTWGIKNIDIASSLIIMLLVNFNGVMILTDFCCEYHNRQKQLRIYIYIDLALEYF